MNERSAENVSELPRASREALEAALGYRFRDGALLALALTHRSVAYEERGGSESAEKNRPGTDNEQLEFLGDGGAGLWW